MMEKRKKANPNCLQLSLGSKQNAVNLILNGHDKNFQISFGSKDGKKSKTLCPGQREIWIPPPGKTGRGKRKSCCLYNEIMLTLPEDGKFVLPYGLPLIIESQHLENFKAALYPPRLDSASVHSCDSFEDQSKRIRQNYEKQFMVAKESEKLLKEHNNRRKVLLKHITLLKKNLEEINKSIQEIESDVTGAQWYSKRSSSDAKTKSLLTEAKNLENIMKQKMRGKEQFDCNIPNNLSSEKIMMNLADNMRKSKMLLDNTLQEKEAINELQTKYIQGVEELYEGQHRLLKRICQALDTTSSSDEDKNVDDNASCCSRVDPELQLSHKTDELKLKFNSLPDLANYLQNQNLAKKLTLANSQLDKLKTELESIKMKSQENRKRLDMNSRQMISSGQKQTERKIPETEVTHKTKTRSNTPENENNVPGNFQAENLPSLFSTQKAMEKLKETLEKIIPIMPKESEMTPVVNHHKENTSVKTVAMRQRKSKRVEKMDRDRPNTQTDSSNDEVQGSDENVLRSSSGTMPAAGRENVCKGSSEDEVKVALKDSSGFEIERVDALPEKQTDDENELITARRKQAKHQDQMTSLPDVTRRPQMDKQGRETAQLDSSTFKPQNESSRLSLASRKASILPKQQSIRYRKKASVTGRPDVSEEFFPNLGHVGSRELNETEASSLNKGSDKLLDQGFIDAAPAYTERFSDGKSRMRDHEGKIVPGTSPTIDYIQPLNDLNTRTDSYNRFSEEKSEDLNQRIKPLEQVNHDDKSKLGHVSNREKYREDASFQSSMNTNDRLISGFISNISQYEESPPDKPPEQVSHGDKSKLGHISNQEKYRKDSSFQSSMNTNDRIISGFISNISQYEESPPDKPPEQVSHGDKSKLGHISNQEKYRKDSSFQSSMNTNDRLISGFISDISQYEESPPDNKISKSSDELISGFISDSSQYEDLSNNSRVHDANDRQITPQNREHLIHTEKVKEATSEGRSHVPLPHEAPFIRGHDNEMMKGNDSEEWHVPELYYGSVDSTNSSEHWHVPELYYGSSLDSSVKEPEYFGNTTSSPRRSIVDRGMDIDGTQGSEHWYRLDSYHGSSISPSVLEDEVFYNRLPETQRQSSAENGATRQPEKDLLSNVHNQQKLRSKSIPVGYDRYGNGVRLGCERMGQNGLRNYPQRRVTYYTTGIRNTKPKFYDLPQIPAIKDPNIRSKSVAAPLYYSAGYNDMTSRRHTLDWNKIQQKKIRNLYNEIMR